MRKIVLYFSFICFILSLSYASAYYLYSSVPRYMNWGGNDHDGNGYEKDSVQKTLENKDGFCIWVRDKYPQEGALWISGIGAMKPPKEIRFLNYKLYRKDIDKIYISFVVFPDINIGAFDHTKNLQYKILSYNHPHGISNWITIDLRPNDEENYEIVLCINKENEIQYCNILSNTQQGNDWITGVSVRFENVNEEMFSNVYLNIDFIRILYISS